MPSVLPQSFVCPLLTPSFAISYPLQNRVADVHTPTMTLKGAALLALIGTVLITAYLMWTFVFKRAQRSARSAGAGGALCVLYLYIRLLDFGRVLFRVSSITAVSAPSLVGPSRRAWPEHSLALRGSGYPF